MSSNSDKKIIGIIANPYSSRDIRRLISSATSIQTVERANIVERIIITLGTFNGIDKVLMMPDSSGICANLIRSLELKRRSHPELRIPEVEFLEMEITSTADDSETATKMMVDHGISAVAVLGGDGTHRVVAKNVGNIPIASISTGTNNAFPRFYEATLVGMALGIYALSLVPEELVLLQNKAIHIFVNDDIEDIALVDAAITSEQWIGARALWHMENLKELYLAFCEPGAIGMSAIGGLHHLVRREDAFGLQVVVADPGETSFSVNTPIAPGLFQQIGIKSSQQIEFDKAIHIETTQGVIALDGEREIEFSQKDDVSIVVKQDGPVTINVEEAIAQASKLGVFINKPEKKSNHSTIDAYQMVPDSYITSVV